jgi:hypothetical protein
VLLCAPPISARGTRGVWSKAGKHIFAEKPIATDPAALRHCLQGSRPQAASFRSCPDVPRHNSRALRMIGPVRDGLIGRDPRRRGPIVARLDEPANTFASADRKTRTLRTLQQLYHFREMSATIDGTGGARIDLATGFSGGSQAGHGYRRTPSALDRQPYDCFGIDYDYGNGCMSTRWRARINGCFDRCCAMLTVRTVDRRVGSKILKPDGTSVPFPFDEKPWRGETTKCKSWNTPNFVGTAERNLLH